MFARNNKGFLQLIGAALASAIVGYNIGVHRNTNIREESSSNQLRSITRIGAPHIDDAYRKEASNYTTLLQQRNEMSRLANKIQQQAMKLQCERRRATAETGGFCSKSNAHHLTDIKLIKGLTELFTNTRVGSFGDGMGVYRKELLKTNRLVSYDSYDGNPFCEEFTNGSTKYLDLALPQYGLPMYDWVMCLEVAEHIPRQYEENFVDNIVRHAKHGIVLSWGKPGQDGFNHVNNRPFEYVKHLMKSKGFRHTVTDSYFLRNSSTFWWLINNVNVYRKIRE